MKRNLLPVSIGLFFCLIISCKKDNNTSSNNLVGNWIFTSMTAQTESDNQYTDGGIVYKTVTISQYTTLNNKGTVVITPSAMAGDSIAYAVSTNATAFNYQNGTLMDSTVYPLIFSVPPSSVTASYNQVGTDSLSFPGGGPFGVPGSSSASGAKYSLSGNTLHLITTIVKDSTNSSYGIPITVHLAATLNSVLTKQ